MQMHFGVSGLFKFFNTFRVITYGYSTPKVTVKLPLSFFLFYKSHQIFLMEKKGGVRSGIRIVQERVG